ncbi:MAG: xanthine dehydrogenase family protein molybdopterin-binding subunit [Nitrospinota bacterium]
MATSIAHDGLRVVGQRVRFQDAPEKALGTALYLDDLQLPGMLVGRALRSARSHARILAVRAERARRVPGVACVLTAEDIGGEVLLSTYPHDPPVIAAHKVRCRGDVVALVAAESPDAAEEALSLIEVAYEPLPAVDDPLQALAPGAPKLFPEGNLLNHGKVRKGEGAGGFRYADVVAEGEYRTPCVDHLYLEVEGACAAFGPDGSLTLWAASQQPFSVRKHLARALGLKGEGRVRFIQTLPGGAFGGKSEAALDAGLRAAFLARAAGRPVKLVYSREESLIASSKRHPMVIRYKTGATRGGKLVAAEVEVYLDKGAYTAYGGKKPPAFHRATFHCTGPYEIPHVHVDVFCAHTNNPYGGQMRAPGCPQVHFACEAQMDALARLLHMDPLELRRRNALRPGSRTASGQRLGESVGLVETIDKAAARFGWADRAGLPRRAPDGRLRGFGAACCWYGTGNAYSGSEAHFFLTAEGTFRLATGVVDFGQGSKTVLSQMAAEVLGVPYGLLHMGNVDTALDPFGGTSTSSRITMQVGNAVVRAAEAAREELKRLAAEMLEVDPSDLELAGEGVRSRSHPETRVSFAELARRCVMDERRLLARGAWEPPAVKLEEDTGQGNLWEVYAFGTQCVEVLVDSDTGEVEVTRVVAAHDVGRAISPLGVEQQVEGGVYMGLSFGLMEELVQRGGQVLSPDLASYLVPTALDVPDRVESLLVESAYPGGPFGAKGAGEPPNVPTAAALASAVEDATGLRLRELPLTAERVRMGLRAVRERG